MTWQDITCKEFQSKRPQGRKDSSSSWAVQLWWETSHWILKQYYMSPFCAEETKHQSSNMVKKPFISLIGKKINYPQCTEITDEHKLQCYRFLIARTVTTKKHEFQLQPKMVWKSKQQTDPEFHTAILMHQATERKWAGHVMWNSTETARIRQRS